MKNYKDIFTSRKISNGIKIRVFQAYICSIFLYNSELWTLTKTLEQQIDAFHRKQLRYVLGIYWPRKISNMSLYTITRAEPWSRVIKRRRLNWLGHLMRLHPETPVQLSLEEALRPAKRPVGHPKTTWISCVCKDLEKANIYIRQDNIDTFRELKK